MTLYILTAIVAIQTYMIWEARKAYEAMLTHNRLLVQRCAQAIRAKNEAEKP